MKWKFNRAVGWWLKRYERLARQKINQLYFVVVTVFGGVVVFEVIYQLRRIATRLFK